MMPQNNYICNLREEIDHMEEQVNQVHLEETKMKIEGTQDKATTGE